jgi:hypothetical protein
MQTNNELIIEFLKNNPGATKAAIGEATGLKGLLLFNGLKKLLTGGEITSQGEGDDLTYTLAEQTDQVVTETVKDKLEVAEETSTAATTEVVAAPQVTPPAENAKVETTRDNSTYKFNGVELNKGKLVHAVVSKYVEDNVGITFKKLKEVFPDTLLKRFGVFQDEETARTISGKYDRYFFKPEHVIKLKDKNVMICNQWTLENIQPFLQKAHELGFKIK